MITYENSSPSFLPWSFPMAEETYEIGLVTLKQYTIISSPSSFPLAVQLIVSWFLYIYKYFPNYLRPMMASCQSNDLNLPARVFI